jgi:UDP-N-acetylmuramoylalanine--D-glutamate ligase
MSKKPVLIYGFGVSGIAAAKALSANKTPFKVIDRLSESKLQGIATENGIDKVEFLSVDAPTDLSAYELIIKSPGIKPNDPLIERAVAEKISILSDIEYAYRMRKDIKSVAITGTNGKTTTTSLLGEMLKNGDVKSFVTGNIGSGVIWDYCCADEESVAVIELSSFQLANTSSFRSNIAIITNITPDHLDWHGSFEEYKADKSKILINQLPSDCHILNYDDEILRDYPSFGKGKRNYFSLSYYQGSGIYVQDNKIYIKIDSPTHLCHVDDIKMPGSHNLENALGASLAAYLLGVDKSIIVKTLKSFNGVAHRLEFVKNINGVAYYNDSKGTNTNATLRALASFDKPIHLILGGYDKGESYHNLIRAFGDKVRSVSVIGEASDRIIKQMTSRGYSSFHRAKTLKEAVEVSVKHAKSGEIVLLSPACASWDMFNDYMERGEAFKEIVQSIGDFNGS